MLLMDLCSDQSTCTFCLKTNYRWQRGPTKANFWSCN